MSRAEKPSKISEILKENESEILQEWLREQTSGKQHSKMMKESELGEQSTKFLSLLQDAIKGGHIEDINSPNLDEMKTFLAGISASRALQGYSTTDTATFIFSFKKPFFSKISQAYPTDALALADEIIRANRFLDKLGLYTSEAYIKTREKIISRQQEEMLELSTPVVKLWDGILALPMIGTLDSSRTQVVMETLLQKIVETGSELAIIDITGVPTVDTLVAQHLLKTVAAARLMGADCIISGIRPQIAQTMVHLGVDLSQVVTKASLADAFIVALARLGKNVSLPHGVRTSNLPAQVAPKNKGNGQLNHNGTKDKPWNAYQL